MKFYAVLNKDNIVVSVKQVKGTISNPNHIEIFTMDDSLMGKKYDSNNKSFVAVPPPAIVPVPVVEISGVGREGQTGYLEFAVTKAGTFRLNLGEVKQV